MDIIIKETGDRDELSIISASNGIDYTEDFIGGPGALSDGQFTYDEDLDGYVCTQATFDWWKALIDDHQALEDRLDALREEHGSDTVDAVIRLHDYADLEDFARVMNDGLNEAFGAAA
jgi:hypothetical protein